MRLVRSIVAIAVAAAGVLAATPSTAVAGSLIADFRCDRGAGTYVCEVRLPGFPAPGPLVWPTSPGISWYVDGVSQGSFAQHRFLTGSCVPGRLVDVVVFVTDPAHDFDFSVPDYDSDADSGGAGYQSDTGTDWRRARFRCLHVEPPGQVPAPVHGRQLP